MQELAPITTAEEGVEPIRGNPPPRGIRPSVQLPARRSGFLAVAGICVLVAAGGEEMPFRAAAASRDSPRIETSLNEGWKFFRAEVAGAEALECDDKSWPEVRLPHTWNNLDGEDGERGGKKYYRGPGWYRRQLGIAAATGKSYFLKFDGANRVTEVFVNGRRIGSHRGGFAAFCFEATAFLKRGDNIIAVRVNNADDRDSPPLFGDFTFCGGLYRDVHLLTLEPLSISPLDDASSGVHIKVSEINLHHAHVSVTSVVRNGHSAEKVARVVTRLEDARGGVVASGQEVVRLGARAAENTVVGLKIFDPHLWHGRQDPYLYAAVVEVYDGERLTDRVVQSFGVRSFAVDPDKGFTLNGQRLALQGVCRHQDHQGMGWAITAKEQREDHAMIQEMGANAVRLAHYQHAQEFYDLCDRGGTIVWSEIPLLAATPEEAFRENAAAQMREMIKQNDNHPSICFWGVFNEAGGGYDRIVRGKQSSTDQVQFDAALAVIKHVNETAKRLDNTRLTTAATKVVSVEAPINFITDILGYNRYFGWYDGEVDGLGKFLDDFHLKFPTRALGISEYGAGASIQHHADPPGRPRPNSSWHPEEYQSWLHEATWPLIAERRYLWSSFVWVMFDFASDWRTEGDRPGINDKGLVTNDRKIRKDAFYYYKAHWNPEPMVYITSRRFNPRTTPVIDVKVYSNCEEVTLRVNGTMLGSEGSTGGVFLWRGVSLKPGRNQVEAVGRADSKIVNDVVFWEHNAAAK